MQFGGKIPLRGNVPLAFSQGFSRVFCFGLQAVEELYRAALDKFEEMLEVQPDNVQALRLTGNALRDLSASGNGGARENRQILEVGARTWGRCQGRGACGCCDVGGGLGEWVMGCL